MAATSFAATLEHLAQGKFIVAVDSLQPRARGCLVLAAERATVAGLDFMRLEGSGMFFLCLSDARCAELGLGPNRAADDDLWQSRLTATISHRRGGNSSLASRLETISVAIDPATGPEDIVQPGEVSPLRAGRGGVLQRATLVEAAVDLTHLAGLRPGAVTGVVVDEGRIMRAEQLIPYAHRHGFPVVTVGSVIEHRRRTEKLVERATSVRLRTEVGEFTAVVFVDSLTRELHLALVKGDLSGEGSVLVRVHRSCFLGDRFRSARCACGTRLEQSLRRIEAEQRGVLVYLARENADMTRCSRADLSGEDEIREFGIGAQILSDLGVSNIAILTDRPKQLSGIEGFGLTVTDQVPF